MRGKGELRKVADELKSLTLNVELNVDVCNVGSPTHNSHVKYHCHNYLLQLLPCLAFLYFSLSTAFWPTISIRRALPSPFPRIGPRTDPSPVCPLLPLSPSLSDSDSDSDSVSSLLLFSPALDETPLPGAIARLTRGGTLNPKAFAILVRSRAFTSNIFFSEYDAYDWRYARYPFVADRYRL